MTRRLLPAVAAAIVAAGLTMGAAAPDAPSADLSTTASTVTPKVLEYVETGVLPTDVTGEPGIWNYAGPVGTCPGLGWNCATLDAFSLPLTQVGTVNVIQCVGPACAGSTQTGYANTFECQPATSTTNTAALQECVISQGGEANQAKCIQKKYTVPFVRQRCSITQTGKDNQATIVQVVEQTGGSVQGALQEAGVSQTATSKNQLQVDQGIKQYTEAFGTQDQDAYQVVGGPFAATPPSGTPAGPTGAATQTAAGAGDSQLQVNQTQTQRAKGGEIQRQNDGATAPLFIAPDDCHESAVSPNDPNLCANLEQTSVSGDNQSQLTQTWDVEATTTEPSANQQQGKAPFTGGADGRVHQVTTAPGFSQGQATQSETLKLYAPPGSNPDQFQYGGAGCCGFASQIGPGIEKIDQKKDLDAVGGTFQSATLVGTSSSPAGACGINHAVQTNSDQATEAASAEPCIALAVITTCENAFVGEEEEEVVGACQETDVEACAPGEEPVVDVEGGDVSVTCQEPFIGPS